MKESFRAQTWGYIASNTSIGTKYDKAVYRGYTNALFQERTKQPEWLGLQGPIIRAEVGDMIEVSIHELGNVFLPWPIWKYAKSSKIMFVNKMEHFFSSMHSMGLFYTKESEGSVYYNGTESVTIGNAVPPGGCFVYKWYLDSSNKFWLWMMKRWHSIPRERLVPEGSAPNKGHDSRVFAYHPYVSMYQDLDAGSYGPVIIYNPGKMQSVMSGNREFVLVYSDNQESNSFLALHNVHKYLPGMASQVANLSYEYPQVTQGLGNHSIWYPQFINTPNTNVTTVMAPNFFPVSLPSPEPFASISFFKLVLMKRNRLTYVWFRR
jgi:hypothetical protein